MQECRSLDSQAAAIVGRVTLNAFGKPVQPISLMILKTFWSYLLCGILEFCKSRVRDGWFAARQLLRDEPTEAGAYSLSSRPSTTCIASSVAVDSITR